MIRPLITRNSQHGAALLSLFLVIFAVGATVFLSSVDTTTVEMRKFQDLRTEMEKAKANLIAYAMNYHEYGYDNDGDTYNNDEGPGRLICPDVDNDGVADSTPAQCTDYVRGRLPERFSFGGGNISTISQSDFLTNSDQQFWYVVSPNFKEITTSEVNTTTAGDLSIDGVGGYVAVIIAPGDPLTGQNRPGGNTTATNYLEQDNLAGTSFINSYPTDPDVFNDQVIGIRATDLKLDEISQHEIDNTPANILYESARQQLADYYNTNGNLPVTVNVLNNYMRNKGYGWLIDEGYMDSIFINYFILGSYPYIRYNIAGCTSYWYWFIPVAPYSPNFTYVSGTPC